MRPRKKNLNVLKMKRKQSIVYTKAISKKKVCGVLSIPSLLNVIFSFVVGKWSDVFVLRQTCQTWHNPDLYTRIPVIDYKTINIAASYKKATHLIFKGLALRFLLPFVDSRLLVNLSILFPDFDFEETNIDFSKLLSCKILTLENPLPLQHVFPLNLEYLSIESKNNISAKVINKLQLPKLQDLTLERHDATVVTWDMPSLKRAYLIFADDLPECDYSTFSHSIPSTCELHCFGFPTKANNFPFHCIAHFALYDDDEFESALPHFHNCVNVTELACDGMREFIDEKFQQAGYFPLLKSLRLSSCGFVNGQFLTHFKFLESITLYNTYIQFNTQRFQKSTSIDMQFSDYYQKRLDTI